MVTSSLLWRAFCGVVATLILAATERGVATFKKKELFFIRAAEEAAATITVGGIFFILGAWQRKKLVL